jgi:DNA-binding transcriptional ArsR family regulator
MMGKAFASPVRLELLDLVARAPRTVDELARASGQSTANTSQHLAEREQRLAELPDDREIVAYCRGPFCAYAHQLSEPQHGRSPSPAAA